MNSNKYTIMLIPDDDSRSKSFFISKNMIRYVLIILFLITASIIVYLMVYLPKIDNYIELKEKYDVFASERLEVLELTRK